MQKNDEWIDAQDEWGIEICLSKRDDFAILK
jgi:hypothetical protein